MSTPLQEANSTNVTKIDVPQVAAFACIGTITVATNSFLLIVLVSKRHLRTASNTLLVSTLIVGILFALLYLIPRWAIPYTGQLPILCALLPSIGQAFFININLHVCSISLERYICIANPFLYDRIGKRRNFIILIILLWVTSTISQFIPLFTFKPIKSTCYYWADDLVAQRYFLIATFVILFFVPLTIIVVSYCRIYVIVNLHVAQFQQIVKQLNSNKEKLTKDRKAIKQIVAMISVFIISFLPFVIEFLIWQDKEFEGSEADIITLRVTQFLAFSYPAISPLLCCWFKANLRREVKRSLHLCWQRNDSTSTTTANMINYESRYRTIDFSTRPSMALLQEEAKNGKKSLPDYSEANETHSPSEKSEGNDDSSRNQDVKVINNSTIV
ncbi:uncharacterized protein TRIADDRAFT_60138 [Trichoplax adhaerens]|uniref:G-protein coupled receptors family 1 profile domain-containing protein n=1 Tax=Trichoplax adhaerens TaxID=10228 RepID=B3S7E6_TRIAD|nr:hypothetical protein TRIADDRAFT_60138 [Trichoplax adhaerens]EDV21184.1 hypothetical protein TRIADDRAFT_60138 [Trichoplax adhaerens]|eukprot:XP_002116151.1 hypothetical protein TRIADDRAFT_60138 [Trichoplax adhaerens]